MLWPSKAMKSIRDTQTFSKPRNRHFAWTGSNFLICQNSVVGLVRATTRRPKEREIAGKRNMAAVVLTKHYIMASWWSFQTIHFCITIKRYAIVFYWLFISWCVYNNSHSFNSAREFAKETIFDAIQHEGIRAKIRATKMRAFELPLFRAFWNSTATKLNDQLKIFLKCPVLYAMFVFRVVTGQEMVREKLNSWRSETDSFDL